MAMDRSDSNCSSEMLGCSSMAATEKDKDRANYSVSLPPQDAQVVRTVLVLGRLHNGRPYVS